MPAQSVELILEKARNCHQHGELLRAEQLYRQALSMAPQNSQALQLLGLLAFDTGRHLLAEELLTQAIGLPPLTATCLSDLGHIKRALGKGPEAIALLERALDLNPACTPALVNLGLALKDAGQLERAIGLFEQAIGLDPANASTWNSLGNAWLARANLDSALSSYRKAVELQPHYADALNNQGVVLKALGSLPQAIDCFRRALQLSPHAAPFHSNLLFALNYHPEYDAARIARELHDWDRRHASPLRPLLKPHSNSPEPDRPLRIGLVSPDFRCHAAAHFLVPLFEAHNGRDYPLYAYSSVGRPDPITKQLEARCEAWRPVRPLSDEQLAATIREDRIDILVDLSQHMAHNRLLLFARKPAPVQLSWLAYPGSTGLRTIDYRITDPFLDPPGCDESLYSEKCLRLPHSFWCYHPLSSEPPVNALPALRNGWVTFGSLNNPCKVNEATLRLWARVLRAVPNSQMLLLAHEGSFRQRVLDCFGVCGVPPSRIRFSAYSPRPSYLRLYHQIDLGLDTFPYNGHTTSFDSFWMGVPVVTIAGATPVGRAGLCALMNLGLPELVAPSPEAFIQIAAGLAANPTRLQTLRSSLRARMESSPLMDAPRFAASFEHALRSVWRQWCARLKAA